ncbi:hypothetical protein ACFYW1_34170 [Streptomyces sp. NPDC002669]|uniref:hypothetical protein n=1 Tax=Streptomyces sp. NPDC002669 TaxID=3364658 RepID=UPI0036C01883
MTSNNVTEAEPVEPSEAASAKSVADRLIDELVGAVDQGDEVALAHTAALALAGGVGAQPGAGAGPHGEQSGHGQPSRAPVRSPSRPGSRRAGPRYVLGAVVG